MIHPPESIKPRSGLPDGVKPLLLRSTPGLLQREMLDFPYTFLSLDLFSAWDNQPNIAMCMGLPESARGHSKDSPAGPSDCSLYGPTPIFQSSCDWQKKAS